MGIHVVTKESSGTHHDATGWVVDDHGYLHVTKQGNGNVATYHAGAWISVERIEVTGSAQNP